MNDDPVFKVLPILEKSRPWEQSTSNMDELPKHSSFPSEFQLKKKNDKPRRNLLVGTFAHDVRRTGLLK